jgi:hypothetical protein
VLQHVKVSCLINVKGRRQLRNLQTEVMRACAKRIGRTPRTHRYAGQDVVEPAQADQVVAAVMDPAAKTMSWSTSAVKASAAVDRGRCGESEAISTVRS